MSPWLIGGIVAYWLVAFYVAHRVGEFLYRTDRPGLRTAAVERRPGVGDVRVLPTSGDAENAGKARRG